MHHARIIVLVGVSVATAGLAARVHAAQTPGVASVDAAQRPSAARCGGNLWRMKTMSDVARRTVRLASRTTTIGDVGARSAPKPVPAVRATPFQKQTWEVVAQVVQYRRDEGELRLVLYDHGSYMNAAIPSPSCLSSRTRGRAAIVSAWNTFTSTCGLGTDDWQPLGAVVFVSGVGFWSQRRAGNGVAPNGAELHPVTGFRAVAGCGS